MREIRKGEVKQTVNGPKCQIHNVWFSTFAHNFVRKFSQEYSLDENAVVGQIVEQFVAESSSIEDRVSFYRNKELNSAKIDKE
jgi:hypothetical protein